MLLRLESVEAERDAMFVKHRAIASMALALVEGKMNWLMQKLEGDEIKVLNSDEIKMEALVRLLDTASKIERMSVLGRLDAQERSAEEQERLEERYAEELAKFTQDFINGVGLSPDQEAKAKEVLAELLAGESK